MTLRIDIEHLAEEIDGALACIEAGDEVLLEREGTVVAALTPRREAKGGLRALVEARRNLPPLDEDWERDMAIVAADINRKPEKTAWES